MGKLIKIHSKKPNAVSIRGGYFPLPLQMVGPNTWHNIMSQDYGISPIDGTQLAKPTFAQVAELAGVALTDRYNQKNDNRYNSLDLVISHTNDRNKVLAGDTLWIVSDKKLYVVNHPDAELSAQFGVNNQEVLESLVAKFDKQLGKEVRGIRSAENIRSVSLSNFSQGEQSRDPKAENYLGKNLGLIASVESGKFAKSLAVGSRAYAEEPYLALNGESEKIVTRVPVLVAVVFGDRLYVYGIGDAGDDGWYSFKYSESSKATRKK